MSLETWGSLQKNQTDPTTIDEAIASAILAHEADPASHLGAGESLETHRSNEAIDHPEQSVLAENIGGGDVVINTKFESISPWTITGGASISGFNGLQLAGNYPTQPTAKANSAMYANAQIFNKDSDMYFETRMCGNQNTYTYSAWWGFVSGSLAILDGFGFQVRAGALYAHVSANGTPNDFLISGADLLGSHLYSAKYVQAEQKIYFYIDKILKATLDVPAGCDWSGSRTPEFGLTVSNAGDIAIMFQYLYAWRKYLTA